MNHAIGSHFRPIIGITTYARNQKGEFTLPSQYVEAVHRAGGIAVLLPPGCLDTAAIVNMIDGLILAGGGDIDPTFYHGTHHESVYMVDQERDAHELSLVEYVLQCDLPTLAICRGAQILNVALGGTLHEHLPDVVGEEIQHRLPPREPTPHRVDIAAGTRLAEIVGVEQCQSYSWHHQSVRDVAESLRVAARAPDGVIEALEHPDHRWLIAVQWHPELSAADDITQQRLFDGVVEEARSTKKR